MHKFVRNLITEWRKLGLPMRDETIIVAVSGGADSMALLLALDDLAKRKKLALNLVIAHFNHKLRGKESDGDEVFVRKEAKRLGVQFKSAGAAVKRSGNLEQNARNARYSFLHDTALSNNASIVLTAHTRNDQAETFLINLIRGSGVDGLVGMGVMRDLGEGVSLWRPLLSWAGRSDTEGFCQDNEIKFRQDRMNDDQAFTRVRVRKAILPLLAELNPKIVETLARTSDLLRQSPANSTPMAASQDAILEVGALKALEKPDLYRELRAWLKRSRGDLRGIQLKHIEALERLIHGRKSGKTVELPGSGRVVKEGGRVTFSNIKVEK